VGKSPSAKNAIWFQPTSMDELIGNIRQVPDSETYRLVAGNTGTGDYELRTFCLFKVWSVLSME
jgi:hypothetical protein